VTDREDLVGAATAGSSVAGALANAPAGPYPLLEVAFAWAERRPRVWRDPGPSRSGRERHLPILETRSAEAASRLARLLSAVTWAVTSRSAEASAEKGYEPPPVRVEVPSAAYHRVIRTMTGAWREGRRILQTPDAPLSRRPAALAVWRMAILLNTSDGSLGAQTIPASTQAGAEMLSAAAHVLDVPHSTRQRGGQTLFHIADRRVAFWPLSVAHAATVRKPALPIEESGVLDDRAALR
jgi:hypothetical protein